MFPLPDWTRLNPKKPQSSGYSPSRRRGQWAIDILALCTIPAGLGGVIAGYALAGRWASWLAIPGAIVGLIVAALVLKHIIIRGFAEAFFFGYITFMFSAESEGPDPTNAWIAAAVVAVLFLVVTYFAWKKQRLESN
jgi:hypothetical protein